LPKGGKSFILAPLFAQDLGKRESVWETNFGKLTLMQEGPLVWGTYGKHSRGESTFKQIDP
jgi:hypothetical protein